MAKSTGKCKYRKSVTEEECSARTGYLNILKSLRPAYNQNDYKVLYNIKTKECDSYREATGKPIEIVANHSLHLKPADDNNSNVLQISV